MNIDIYDKPDADPGLCRAAVPEYSTYNLIRPVRVIARFHQCQRKKGQSGLCWQHERMAQATDRD